MRQVQGKHRPRSSGPRTSSQSLCSIPEDQHGESEDDQEDDIGSVSGSVKSDTESLQSSSKSSAGSAAGSAGSEDEHSEGNSQDGMCCSPPRSISEGEVQRMTAVGRSHKSPLHKPLKPPLERPKPPMRDGPPMVKLRSAAGLFDLNLDDFASVHSLRAHIQATTGVPASRQTLILAGRRLPLESEELDEAKWLEIKASVRPGQTLMLIGSALKSPAAATATCSSPTAKDMLGATSAEQDEEDAAADTEMHEGAAGEVEKEEDEEEEEEAEQEDHADDETNGEGATYKAGED